MKILNHTLKIGNPLFKVAEISANHNGSLDLAKKTIEAAKTSGADAVKLQTYTADTITINSDNEENSSEQSLDISEETSSDEDDLEIPAFLRRQKN